MSITLIAAASAEAAAAAAAAQFGFMAAMEQGGPVAWSTLAVMVIMFVGSLYILFTKLFEQNKIMKQGRDMQASFWRANSLEEGANKLEKNSAFRQVVEDGLKAKEEHVKLTDPVEAHDWMHGTMERSQNHIMSVLGGGLSFLATVGATAPFVGLFGTVWGILNALIKIAQTGDPSISAVAGPVGEALIMTAIGLVVAVPAVMAYNWLQGRNKVIARDLSTFSNDVLGYIMSNGQVRPTVRAAAPAAAAKPAAAKA
ncbi:MAG: MotA/TolQ/ExbB proton channel family protein [Sphingopyxis sp.]|nr:MotA/TolQ/ExbB proton channel family protein [Sphingopyxis sp.]